MAYMTYHHLRSRHTPSHVTRNISRTRNKPRLPKFPASHLSATSSMQLSSRGGWGRGRERVAWWWWWFPVREAQRLLFDRKYFWYLASLIITADAALSALIIARVNCASSRLSISVAPVAARYRRRATHASQSQKSTSTPTYNRLISSSTVNATTPVFLVTPVHSCTSSSRFPLPAFHFRPSSQHPNSRIKLSSRPRPPPSRPQTHPRCHLTRHHPGHLRRPLPRLPIPSRLDIL